MNLPRAFSNFIFNAFGRIGVIIINFLFVPIFLNKMGESSYGIIGLYITMITVFQFLDFGIGTSLSKYLAKARHTPLNNDQRLYFDPSYIKSSETVYVFIGLLTGVLIAIISPLLPIVQTGFKDNSSVDYVFFLIGVTFATQWMCNFYVAGLNGTESQGVLNLVRLMGIVLANVLSLSLLFMLSPSLDYYFTGQLLGWLITLAGYRAVFIHALPASLNNFQNSKFNLSVLKPTIEFNIGMTVLALISLAASQMDKIFLTKHGTIAQYAYYMLSIQVANALGALASSVYNALFPKVVSCSSCRGQNQNASHIYAIGTAFMVLIILPNASALVVLSKEIMEAWLGKSMPSETIYITNLLVLGSMLNSIMQLPFMVQLSYSYTRFSLIKNAVVLTASLPFLYVLFKYFGIPGVASYWLLQNLFFYIIEPYMVMRRYIDLPLSFWYLNLTGLPIVVSFSVSWILNYVLSKISTLPLIVNYIVIVISVFAILCCVLYIGLSKTLALEPGVRLIDQVKKYF